MRNGDACGVFEPVNFDTPLFSATNDDGTGPIDPALVDQYMSLRESQMQCARTAKESGSTEIVEAV